MTWFWATVTGIVVGGMLGVLFGRVGWARRWCLAAVALLGVTTALVVSIVRSDSPNWLWWSLSVILAMAACTLAWSLARGNVALQTWVAVVGVVILVGGVATVGYHAGTTVARATTTTPHDAGNAAGIDPADCSQASLSAARPSKPYRWIALGDSYSAGVGGELNGTAFGQDITNAFAWAGAKLLHSSVDHAYFGMTLSACSGAVARDLFHTVEAPGEALSYERVKSADLSKESPFWYTLPDDLQSLKDAAVVTLTVGGNDAGFGNIAKSLGADGGCLAGRSCQLLSDGGLANLEGKGRDPIPEGAKNEEWKTLERRLQNAYEVTRVLMPFDADLYVVKYPLAFAEPATCSVGRDIGPKNRGLINEFSAKLDSTIDVAAKAAAETTGRPVHVLNWGDERWQPSNQVGGRAPSSPHGICGNPQWLNDIGARVAGRTIDDSFHPSTAGALAAACATARYIAQTSYFAIHYKYEFTPDSRCEGTGMPATSSGVEYGD